MMKKLYMLTLMLISICAVSAQTMGKYFVKGHIDGLPDGSNLQLFEVSHTKSMPLLSTKVKNGDFTLSGQTELPKAVYLVSEGQDRIGYFMLENEQTRLTAKAVNGSKGIKFEDFRVEGSPLSLKYQQLLAVRHPLDSIYEANQHKHAEIFEAYNKAYASHDSIEMKRLQGTPAYKEMRKDDSLFFARVEHDYNNTFLNNKDSFWGPLMMISLLNYITKDSQPIYDAFSEEVRNSYYGRLVKQEIAPDDETGQPIKDFRLTTDNGKSKTLKELTKGKRLVLLDFWASWCMPCRKEIPNLKRIYQEYAQRGFQIISISIDRREAAWRKALNEEQLSWPNCLDKGEIADLYAVRFVPTMYLFDSNGKIVAVNLRGEELKAKVAELLK